MTIESDPKVAPYMTSDKTSFAYSTARDRWPVILTGAINDIRRAIAACEDESEAEEGKQIVEGIAMLKYEIQLDRALTPLVDDGQRDSMNYNEELKALGPLTWFNAPWLYAECYLYRCLNTFFALSKYWKSYDVFAKQKSYTFKSSRPAVVELAAKYKKLIQQLESDKTANKSSERVELAEELLFTEICEICLWGNATDLSLLTTLTYEDIQKLQGSEARKASENNVIVKNLSESYKVLKEAQKKSELKQERRIDIVLDNAGFELFVDLILAGYLLSANLATHVVLHPKSTP